MLAAKFEALLPHLDERGRRLVHAVAARSATRSTGCSGQIGRMSTASACLWAGLAGLLDG